MNWLKLQRALVVPSRKGPEAIHQNAGNNCVLKSVTVGETFPGREIYSKGAAHAKDRKDTPAAAN